MAILLFIFFLTLNGISQGDKIDNLFKKISTIDHEKNIMQNKIKQLEEDVYKLKRKVKLKQKAKKQTVS